MSPLEDLVKEVEVEINVECISYPYKILDKFKDVDREEDKGITRAEGFRGTPQELERKSKKICRKQLESPC